MLFPALTAAYAGVAGLIFALLSVTVIGSRGLLRVNLGDGGRDTMMRRVRIHANFAEYVPLILLLVALLEMGGAARSTIHALLLPLLIARVMHPVGMLAREGAPQQFIFRGVGAAVTLAVLTTAAILLLRRAGA